MRNARALRDITSEKAGSAIPTRASLRSALALGRRHSTRAFRSISACSGRVVGFPTVCFAKTVRAAWKGITFGQSGEHFLLISGRHRYELLAVG
jgi:hypothetical protein